ncbi:hypothetical protein I7I51_00199 [Histoplasma capsulatum]|uniref:Uncharacterized protein n=1 Tax=Ajellomyces capsulatus TaxID=5037 RepID=A0A8A1MF34_AJECA|nr:hypothetical protein I7I51_00199 [Histoplasma capsulatum]
MPCLVSLGPSRKPQEPDDDLAQPQRQLKWLKLSGPRPAYWDNLSKICSTPKSSYPFHQSMSARSSGRRKRHAGSTPDHSDNKATTKASTKASSTTAYSRNFQQNLADHGVYPPGYKNPDGQKPAKPNNWLELHE